MQNESVTSQKNLEEPAIIYDTSVMTNSSLYKYNSDNS